MYRPADLSDVFVTPCLQKNAKKWLTLPPDCGNPSHVKTLLGKFLMLARLVGLASLLVLPAYAGRGGGGPTGGGGGGGGVQSQP